MYKLACSGLGKNPRWLKMTSKIPSDGPHHLTVMPSLSPVNGSLESIIPDDIQN
jgi:hypothetical protein